MLMTALPPLWIQSSETRRVTSVSSPTATLPAYCQDLISPIWQETFHQNLSLAVSPGNFSPGQLLCCLKFLTISLPAERECHPTSQGFSSLPSTNAFTDSLLMFRSIKVIRLDPFFLHSLRNKKRFCDWSLFWISRKRFHHLATKDRCIMRIFLNDVYRSCFSLTSKEIRDKEN